MSIDPRNPLGLDEKTLAEVERESQRLQEQEEQRRDEKYLMRDQLLYLLSWLAEEQEIFKGQQK